MSSGIVLLKAYPSLNFIGILSKLATQSLSTCTPWNDACERYTLLHVHQLKDHAPELVNESLQSNEFKM